MNKLEQYALGLKVYYFKDVLNNVGFLPSVGTMEQGVQTGDKIGLIDGAGYEDGIAASCNPTWKSHTFGSELTWTIAKIGIFKEYCEDNLAAEMQRNKQLYKLQANDAFLKIVRDYMGNAIANSALLNAFFGDTSSSTTSLKNMDGVLKQVAAFVTDDSKRHTDIGSGNNTDAFFETAGNATKYMRKLITDADPLLRMAPDAEIVMTQKMWDALATDMMINKGLYIETEWKNLFGGLKETTWGGYRVIVVPSFDAIASSVSGNALASYPYYALFTTKSNLRFGSLNTDEAGVSKVDINDDPRNLTTLVNAVFTLGAIVVDGKMIQVLY